MAAKRNNKSHRVGGGNSHDRKVSKGSEKCISPEKTLNPGQREDKFEIKDNVRLPNLKSFWEKIVPVATLLSGVAAVAALGISIVGIKNAKAQLYLDQRAWLGVTRQELLRFEPGKFISGTLRIANSGKTPAVDVEMFKYASGVGPESFGKSLADQMQLIDRQMFAHTSSAPTVAPSSSFEVDLEDPNGREDPDLITKIKSRKMYEYFRGVIRYHDVLGGPAHITTYCLYVEVGVDTPPPAPKLEFCDVGNEMH